MKVRSSLAGHQLYNLNVESTGCTTEQENTLSITGVIFCVRWYTLPHPLRESMAGLRDYIGVEEV